MKRILCSMMLILCLLAGLLQPVFAAEESLEISEETSLSPEETAAEDEPQAEVKEEEVI